MPCGREMLPIPTLKMLPPAESGNSISFFMLRPISSPPSFPYEMGWLWPCESRSNFLFQFSKTGYEEPNQQRRTLHQEQTQEHGDRGQIRPQQLTSVRVRHVGKVKSKRAGIRSIGIQSNVMRKNRLQYRQDIKTKRSHVTNQSGHENSKALHAGQRPTQSAAQQEQRRVASPRSAQGGLDEIVAGDFFGGTQRRQHRPALIFYWFG